MTRICVVLAGGASRRMDGKDKGALELGGRRLIDHVAGKLGPQADRLIIAGPHDYDLALLAIADREDGPAGPAAALWAVGQWLCENEPDVKGFVSAPVDGPFLPLDLFEKLAGEGGCAIAEDESRAHPTFAYWELRKLMPALADTETGKGTALQAIAKKCNAKRVRFPDAAVLMNVNSPADLKRAEVMVARAAPNDSSIR